MLDDTREPHAQVAVVIPDQRHRKTTAEAGLGARSRWRRGAETTVPRQSGGTQDPIGIVSRPPLALLTCLSLVGPASPALAQVESFMLQPGSSVGPGTKVTPTNCVTGPDGSVTCDTKLENSPSDTPAKPQYQPFKN